VSSGLRKVIRRCVRFESTVYTSPDLLFCHGREVLVEHNAEDVRGSHASVVVSHPQTGDRICVADAVGYRSAAA
jgi:hypothetical protein